MCGGGGGTILRTLMTPEIHNYNIAFTGSACGNHCHQSGGRNHAKNLFVVVHRCCYITHWWNKSNPALAPNVMGMFSLLILLSCMCLCVLHIVPYVC